MEKLSFFLVLAVSVVVLSACTSNEDVYDPSKVAAAKEKQYEAAFVKKYGEIASDQDWGFGKGTVTRAANPNSNQWAEFTVVPAKVTTAEADEVTKWFKENQNPVSVSVDWTDFFVQHVSSLHSNMDYLVAANDDHINNFNAASGSIMLMQNSGTSSFGYHNSLDSKMHYKYTIQEISGAYYVGFDFEATGQNPNQKENADGYYSDWIVKISPALPKSDSKRIIAEDLGSSDDFDFNDVVFDVATKDGKTVITLQAAGGTMPLYIKVGGEQKEVHEAFGVSVATMVNTGLSEKDPVVLTYQSTDEVEILVESQTAGTYKLKADCGKAPQMICVPVTYQWTNERESIESKYPKFKDWVGNTSISWLD